MKKRRLFIFISALFFTIYFAGVVHAEQSGKEVSVIIGFKENIDLTVLDGIDYDMNHLHYIIQAASVTIPDTSIEEIQQNDKVAWVEMDKDVSIAGQTVDWGYQATIDQEAQKLDFTGKGVKIGIIDTGVSKTHPDLKIKGGVSFVGNSNSYQDDNGHGTHIAGVIVAQNNDIGTVGIAPDADVYAIKSLDQYGGGKQGDVIKGIEWAITNKLDIINLSITSCDASPALEETIRKAYKSGIMIVAASGNYDDPCIEPFNDIKYPARYSDVIGVGAINKYNKLAGFSYTGKSLQLTAPGEDIMSTFFDKDGNDTYKRMSGTSMAAPYVTGTLALYKEAYPQLTAKQIKETVYRNALDLGEKGKDRQFGYGLVQAPNSKFWDVVSRSWYAPYINYLTEQKYAAGYPGGDFRPAGYITRGEVVTIVGTAMQLDGTRQATRYQDVDPNYFGSGYISSATIAGWITGYENNIFKPNTQISRGDVALIVQNAFQLPRIDGAVFKDIQPNQYYASAINTLAHAKVISGYLDQTYQPEQKITRAEFAVIISKALDGTLR